MSVVDQVLIEKIRQLPPQQFAVIEDFVEFLTDKANKRSALDRFLSVAPAMEAAGVPPLTEEEIAAEIQAIRKPSPLLAGSVVVADDLISPSAPESD